MKKAILYQAKYLYDVGNVFVREIAQGLNELGWETVLLNLMDEQQCTQATDRSLYRDCDLLFCLNGVRPEVPNHQDDFRFFRDTGCVCFNMVVDPPLRLYRRLFWNHDITSFVDRSCLRWVREYLQLPAQTVFLPHGGSAGPLADTPWEQRNYDVIFTGTWRDPSAYLAVVDSFHPYVKNILHDGIDLLTQSSTIDPFDALIEVMDRRGNRLNERPDIFRLLAVHYAPYDNFIRARNRLHMLEELDYAGIAVDIWGKHWPEGKFTHHRLHPGVNPAEVARLMGQSKFVLDLGGFANGAHERIFTAMLNGAVAVALDNPYLKEQFSDDTNICLYDFQQADTLPDRLTALLQGPAKATAIAAGGQLCARQTHSWKHRAATIADLTQKFKEGKLS